MTAKLYHQNGCTQCEAAVLDCRANADGTFDILLDRTAIYPEGGGQLSDTGYIGSARCTHAREEGGNIWHSCDRPLDIGQCVHVAADEAVRLDHTQQHTGEHMLSGLAHSMFGCTNVGFHMADDIVTVDFDKPLSAEQIAELELKVNEAIQRDEPTRTVTVTPEEYETIEIRKKAKGLQGEITVVYAGGVDSCTCCGTHCQSAGQVGVLKILSHMNYKGGVRIGFVCGMRAVLSMQRDSARMDAIARRFSTSADKAVDAVIKQGDELAAMKREFKQRTDMLLDYRAKELAEKAELCGKTRAVVTMEEGLEANELGFLCEKLCACGNMVAVVLSQKDEMLSYRVARSADVALSMRELIQAVNALFGGKGGGRDDSAQGSAKLNGSAKDSVEQLKAYVYRRIKG